MTPLVHYDLRDQVAAITLDSPENRNALSRTLMAELIGRLTAAGQDREVRAVVLTPATSPWPPRPPRSGSPRPAWACPPRSSR